MDNGKKVVVNDPWFVDDVIATIGEALGFARIAAGHWKKGPIAAPPGETMDYVSGSTVGVSRRQQLPTVYPRVWTETAEEMLRRSMDRFIDLLEGTQRRNENGRIDVPPRWDQTIPSDRTYERGTRETWTCSDRTFIELVCDYGLPNVRHLFRYGPCDEDALSEYERIAMCAKAAARSAWAGSGTLSLDETRVLLEWRAHGTPLSYRDVTRLIYNGRSFSAQESRTGRFVDRFAEKVEGEKGDLTRVPYRLHPAAASRPLPDLVTHSHVPQDISDAALEMRIAKLDAELKALRALRESRGLATKVHRRPRKGTVR